MKATREMGPDVIRITLMIVFICLRYFECEKSFNEFKDLKTMSIFLPILNTINICFMFQRLMYYMRIYKFMSKLYQ